MFSEQKEDKPNRISPRHHKPQGDQGQAPRERVYNEGPAVAHRRGAEEEDSGRPGPEVGGGRDPPHLQGRQDHHEGLTKAKTSKHRIHGYVQQVGSIMDRERRKAAKEKMDLMYADGTKAQDDTI